jgi:hypothetical protein
VYRMIPSWPTTWNHAGRIDAGHDDPGCTGTVALTASAWQRCTYNEQCRGYGAEDGILLRAIRRAGIQISRAHQVAHVAHTPEDDQQNIPGHGRPACWNRETINPDRFKENRSCH